MSPNRQTDGRTVALALVHGRISPKFGTLEHLEHTHAHILEFGTRAAIWNAHILGMRSVIARSTNKSWCTCIEEKQV